MEPARASGRLSGFAFARERRHSHSTPQARIDRPVEKRRASQRLVPKVRIVRLASPRQPNIRSWPTKRPTQFVFFSPSGSPALRRPSTMRALLGVEGRVVGPVKARPGLDGEVWIEFPQLHHGLLGLLLVAGQKRRGLPRAGSPPISPGQ